MTSCTLLYAASDEQKVNWNVFVLKTAFTNASTKCTPVSIYNSATGTWAPYSWREWLAIALESVDKGKTTFPTREGLREAVLKISMLHLGAKLMTGGYIHIPKKKKSSKESPMSLIITQPTTKQQHLKTRAPFNNSQNLRNSKMYNESKYYTCSQPIRDSRANFLNAANWMESSSLFL